MEPVELKPLPPREALEYFRSKGYAPALQRFDYRDHWREEHARDFVVAKAMQDDVLELIRQNFDSALAEGTTLARFQSDLAPQLRARGWWGRGIQRDPLTGEIKDVQLGSMHRLKVIFDTNMRTSYAAGQWARLQRTKDFLPYLEYRQIERDTAREEHKPFDGLILPVDHPVWEKIFPPNGWFCGCSVRAVNDRMLKREGKSVTSEEELAALATAPWTNPRTGKTENLFEGLDPSFASNPGSAWLDTDARHAASQLDLPAEVAAYDRGYVKALAALRLRDERNAALLYPRGAGLAAQPVDMTRSGDGALSDVMVTALSRPEADLVLLRAVETGEAFPIADLAMLGSRQGLSQIAVTSPDGSIFRVARIEGDDQPMPSDLDGAVDRVVGNMRRRGLGNDMTDEDLRFVIAHTLLRSLADAGSIEFASAPSGRLGLLLERSANLITVLLQGLGA